MKSFLSGCLGVLVGMMILNIIRDGEINWEEIGYLITPMILLLLFRLGLNLYKKSD